MAKRYQVRNGECINSIADAHGFFPDDLWGAPENADLRDQRKNPNSLAPGDVIVIPDKTLKSYQVQTDKVHQFKVTGVPAKLGVQVLDDDEPVRHAPYVLTVDRSRHEGTTDGDGMVEAWIPPAARRATLEVEVDEGDIREYELELGALAPIETIVGVQQRLRNLGYECGETGRLDDAMREALEAFQADAELEVNGELDDTRAAIEKKHDAKG